MNAAYSKTEKAPHYRHAPTLPANQELILSERTDRNGRRYFFGFVGTQKYFMTQDRARPATWRLYSQSLRPGPDADTLAEPERGPLGGPIVRAVPDRPGFVSGLPDRRKPGDDGP